MKKVGILLVCALVLSLSCKKAVDEAIDCVIELVFANISYTANPDDPKEINLTVNYAGEFSISVGWEFGDGTSETKIGTTITHLYDSAGAYPVKANITLSGDNHSSCSTSKSKTVDVN
ncbi:MAG: PKD domain-containing protein [Bacteroidia bacterium]|nr:PKD domain-containing protein [Bacteroidia bacterium]